ncbi:MAG: tyrosine-type recombinase/integrase [Cytophagales bacterium]|nr:tyrosine-type recombinase/integrase [Cytophagales bacterium]
MNLKESKQLFFDHCRYEKNLSAKTLQFYEIDLIQFEKFLSQSKVELVREITKHHIKGYIQELSSFQPRTIKRKIASSKSFLNFLEFEDYIPVNPYRKVKLKIKEPKQLPTVMDLGEIKRLFLLVKEELQMAKRKSTHAYGEKLRDLCIMELLFATGLRVSELCKLRVPDLNFETGRVLIRGKGNKERVIQIVNQETLRTVLEYHSEYQNRIEQVGFFLSAGLTHRYLRNRFVF